MYDFVNMTIPTYQVLNLCNCISCLNFEKSYRKLRKVYH